MNDFIFNVLPTQGPTLPDWLPIIGGVPINSPLVGSFLAIVVSVTIATITIIRTSKSNRNYIETVEQASLGQIIETRHWMDLKRKLLLKSLIKELEHNVSLYTQLVACVEKEEYLQFFFNFSLITTETCLSSTPIDKEDINNNLLKIHYIIKSHDNKITGTITPSISKDSLKNLLDGVVKDYIANKSIINTIIESIKTYESQIEVAPLNKSTSTPGEEEIKKKGWW